MYTLLLLYNPVLDKMVKKQRIVLSVYINNVIYQSNPNIANPTTGYGSMNGGQQNNSGLFYQNSNHLNE